MPAPRTARIEATAYWLPERYETNEDIAREFDGWDTKKAGRVTGVEKRHISDIPLSDMATNAAEKLLTEHAVDRSTVDFLIVVTQTGDYRMPGVSTMIQDRLGLGKHIGAFDINLGCSGFVYALAVAKSLIAGGMAQRILLVTGEKPTSIDHPKDRTTRVLFGDAATATLVSCEEPGLADIGEFDFGTDGSGAKMLYVPAGGTLLPSSEETAREFQDESGNIRSQNNIYIDGMGIFNFSIKSAPVTIARTLEKNALAQDDIAQFVLHQANKMILDTIRDKMKIPKERFYINMKDIGNTSSNTLPIALSELQAAGALRGGDHVLLCGFGIGLSWATTVVTWR